MYCKCTHFRNRKLSNTLENLDFIYATNVQAEFIGERQRNVFHYNESHSGYGKSSGIILSALDNVDENRNQLQSIIFCVTFDTAFQTYYRCANMIEISDLNIKLCLETKHGVQGADPAHAHIIIGTSSNRS